MQVWAILIEECGASDDYKSQLFQNFMWSVTNGFGSISYQFYGQEFGGTGILHIFPSNCEIGGNVYRVGCDTAYYHGNNIFKINRATARINTVMKETSIFYLEKNNE